MTELIDELADEFVVRYRRGEEPDLRAYLERAGEQRDELARLVEVLLRAVPPPEPTPEAITLARAWVAEQDPPLLALRVDRGLRREQVVDSLAEGLKLAPGLREKLSLRYHELETGQLEPARVDRRVWQALSETLHARAEELIAWARPLPSAVAPVMFRADSPKPLDATFVEDRPAPDEVDRLFGLS
jgi:hypothetical protein